jgi:probable F420-dependent oxidoreductase
MRFTYLETFCDITQLGPLAVAAEKAGFHAYGLPESIFFPQETDNKYPYLASGNRDFINNPILDPFIAATHMAALTKKIELSTFVVKLAVRNPILAAKSALSVGAISGGRFNFGVGLSPWPEDFAVCGQPWEQRGKRLDEMIKIIRGLSTGDFFEFHGKFYDFAPLKINPVPRKPMKILMGGHADAAIRRAVELCDGWMHAGGDADTLDPLFDKVQATRKEMGKQNEPFEIHVISMDAYSPDGVRRLEDRGVTDVIVGFRNVYDPTGGDMTLEQKIGALNQYAENVIHKSKSL